ncbi:MAG TPA: beta-ketoacyl synthase N-terminal-like domain-containing protein, partial [Thermodesulfobacteriota bacterium]|nr:beta-ketoacyl synthase N-terminal-like domain-containing protein [Thermodesulfobacteriota bacterium]
MKDRVFIVGVGMTKMSKQGGSYEDLCRTAISEAMEDAALSFEGDKGAIGGIWYGNCAQGFLTSQHCIRGQVVLRRLGFECMPVVNVENACATATTALHDALHYVMAGGSDLALAVGVEKMMPDLATIQSHPEIAAAVPHMALAAFWMGCEQDRRERYIEQWRREKSEALGIPFEQTDVGKDRSPFMDYYAVKALKLMKKYGYTQEQIARVCAKTHHHSTMNPKAQYQKDFTWEEVMADKPITFPLTRPMCAPTGEG